MFILRSKSLINSSTINFLLKFPGKQKFSPICKRLETSVGISVFERLINQFSLVTSNGLVFMLLKLCGSIQILKFVTMCP